MDLTLALIALAFNYLLLGVLLFVFTWITLGLTKTLVGEEKCPVMMLFTVAVLGLSAGLQGAGEPGRVMRDVSPGIAAFFSALMVLTILTGVWVAGRRYLNHRLVALMTGICSAGFVIMLVLFG